MARRYDIEKETWQNEGFDSFEEYQAAKCYLVECKFKESDTFWKSTKQLWYSCDKRLDMERTGPVIFTGSYSSSESDLPLVPQAIEEAIAVMTDTLPKPTVSPRQASQEEMCSALNYFIEEELDSNDFNLLMARVALDIKRFNLGVVKQTVDLYQRGPLGHEGKVILKKIDPRYVYPDPFSKGWRFEDYRYLIVCEPMDLSEIAEKYPDRGHLVKCEESYSLGMEEQGEADVPTTSIYDSPMNQNKSGTKRERVILKELWIKDEYKYFVPDEDEDGNPLKDMNGEEIGKWVKLYPNGRLIVIANKTLLLDIPNPFRHGEPPYTFFPGRVTSKLLAVGDIEWLFRMEEKINRLHKAMLRNAHVGMNSPWIIDRNAFDSPQKFKNITQEAGLVLPVTPGARVDRIQPAELPQFIFPLVDWLQHQFDYILGIPDINRGQLVQGAQLSTEAVTALQGAAGSRLKFKQKLMEEGLKHLGQQLQWNIRQFYPTERTYLVTDPSTQKPVPVYWSGNVQQPDFAVAIEVASGLPGAKQSRLQMALTLWQNGLIGRSTTLKMMEFPGAEAAAKERDDELKELAAVNLKEAVKLGYRNNSNVRGRKPVSMA